MIAEDYNENYITGWVKIFRSIRNHWIWDDPVKFQWWVDILLEVNHSDKKIAIGYKVFDCKKGESLNSLITWGKRWGASKSVVNNFFRMLENDGMIITKNETVTKRLTVCNYEQYQQTQNGNETQQKRKKTQQSTNKNVKNEKNNILTWKNDFEIYKKECKQAYKQFINDKELMQTQQRLNPGIDLELTIEKGFTNYWGTEAGWKKKKQSRTKDIDWKSTIVNSISSSMNRVYKK